MEVGQGPNWGCSTKEKKNSLYLITIRRQYIYSSIEDSEVVLVFESNNAGLKKLSSKFCLNRQVTHLPS
jgi:hypothetical protein